MTRFVEIIDVPIPLDASFDLLADFSRTAEWDPGVKSATCTTSAPVRAGSRFRVEVELLGRTQTYGYAITHFERPHRIVLEGGDASVRLTDEVTFVARGQGTRITYEVQCRPVGLGCLANPFIAIALPIIGRRAANGLERYGHQLAAAKTDDDAVTGSRQSIDSNRPPSDVLHQSNTEDEITQPHTGA